MRHLLLRLSVALLTFIVGVACTISYRAINVHHCNLLLEHEAALRNDLYKMRTIIDQYAADRGCLPGSLDDLVRAKYLRELPKDTITGQRDWVVVLGTDPNVSERLDGIIDVHSASLAKSGEGTPYKEW